MFLSPAQIVTKLPLQAGQVVADFGCGSGAYLGPLSNAVGSQGKVYAFDLQKDILERLEREAEKFSYMNIEFAIVDVEDKTYLEKKSCDAIILSNILFQVANPLAVIREAKRILKPNGFLLIVDWKKNPAEKLGIKFGPHPTHVLGEEKVLAMLAKNDFSIKKHLPAGEFHYAFIAEL